MSGPLSQPTRQTLLIYFSHISLLVKCTHTASLWLCTATGGTGFSDHVNALLVGLDLLKKALKARPALSGPRARRRLIMMGTLDAQVGGGEVCVGG